MSADAQPDTAVKWLRCFPASLALLVRHLPPVRHVATFEAVELPGNAVVTPWANTPVVTFGLHCVVLSLPNLFCRLLFHVEPRFP